MPEAVGREVPRVLAEQLGHRAEHARLDEHATVRLVVAVQPGETLTPPAEKLVAIYPSEGSMWSDNPAVVLNADVATVAAGGLGAAAQAAASKVPPARRSLSALTLSLYTPARGFPLSQHNDREA